MIQFKKVQASYNLIDQKFMLKFFTISQYFTRIRKQMSTKAVYNKAGMYFEVFTINEFLQVKLKNDKRPEN